VRKLFFKAVRGVICKVEKHRYYVLTPQGNFESVSGRPPGGLTLGDEVSGKTASLPMKLLAAAAVFALIFAGSMLAPERGEALYALTIDFNPSLTISYDRALAVQKIRAYNPGGQELVDELASKEGENLYTLLNRLADLALEKGLLQDKGEVFISTEAGVPLDGDLLLGAFEGRGIDLSLVQVTLTKRIKDKSVSPLRGWLTQLAKEAGDEAGQEAIQVLAAKYLPPSQAVRSSVPGWFEEPLLQYLVGEYRVRGGFINSLLARGFSGEDIELVLALAQVQKLPPGQLVKNLEPAKAREVLAEKPGFKLVKDRGQMARDLDLERQSLEYLAVEFGYPVGRLTSLLKQVGDTDTLSALLVLERQGAGELQHLVQSLQRLGGNLEKLMAEVKAPGPGKKEEVRQELEKVKENTGRAKKQESIQVDELASQANSSRSNVVWLLARGYTRPQCQAILRAAEASGHSVTSVTRHLEEAKTWSAFLDQLGLRRLQEPQLEQLFQRDKPGKGR
jgi:hypothetical protein